MLPGSYRLKVTAILSWSPCGPWSDGKYENDGVEHGIGKEYGKRGVKGEGEPSRRGNEWDICRLRVTVKKGKSGIFVGLRVPRRY